MKQLLLLCLGCLFALEGRAQLGIQASSSFSSMPSWQVAYENGLTRRHSSFLRFGTLWVLDYRLNKKDHPVVFAPAIRLNRSTQYYRFHNFELLTYGVQAGVGLDVLRIGRLPKQNEKRKSKLEVLADAAIERVSLRYDQPVFEEEEFSGQYIKYKQATIDISFGGALSATYRVSRSLQVGPYAGFRYYPSVTWLGLTGRLGAEALPTNLETSPISQLYAGVRIEWDLRSENENLSEH